MRNFAVTVLLSSAAMMSLASAADAQDARWTGAYGGGHIGYAFGFPTTEIEESELEKVWDVVPGPGQVELGSAASLRARDGEFEGSVGTDLSGVVGGIHVGYNVQVSNLVFGIEGAYNWGRLNGSASQAIPEPELSSSSTGNALIVYNALQAGTHTLEGDPEFDLESSFGNVKSIKGRIGIASGNMLLYGVGGAAWTSYKASLTSPDGFSGGQVSGTANWGENVNGWVAGGGFEYRISTNLSLRAEALHYDFGTVDFAFDSSIDPTLNNIETLIGSQDLTINEVNIGISYHLN